MNSAVSFNKRLSVTEKIKITYTEERSIHYTSNYYRVSRYTMRYWIKEKEELMYNKNQNGIWCQTCNGTPLTQIVFSPTREWGVLSQIWYFKFEGSKLGFELFLTFIQYF